MEGLKALVDWAGSVTSWSHAVNKEKKQETKDALEALLAAVRETRPYVEQMKGDPHEETSS
jgi:hypothetical protein